MKAQIFLQVIIQLNQVFMKAQIFLQVIIQLNQVFMKGADIFAGNNTT